MIFSCLVNTLLCLSLGGVVSTEVQACKIREKFPYYALFYEKIRCWFGPHADYADYADFIFFDGVVNLVEVLIS